MHVYHLKKSIITEGYVGSIASRIALPELAQLFASEGKLSGYLSEDTDFLHELSLLLLEKDEESQEVEFDPFSHLAKAKKIDVKKDCVLSINRGNDKLQHMDIAYVSLPAGYTCPFADKCKSIAHRSGGKFKSGKSIIDYGDIRCYAATAELYSPDARRARWRNFDLLKQFKGDTKGMADLILRSLDYYEQTKRPIKIFRIHDSGDFFSQEYFDAWVEAASERPDILFYAYTKSLPFWAARKKVLPKNLRLIASAGGKRDDLIDKEQFRQAVIVKDQGEAIEKRLRIDVNDFLAAFGDEDFALLLHGIQPAATKATPIAKRNQKIIKQKAKELGTSPEDVEDLLRYYTEPRAA